MNIREERIQRLLEELRYEVTRGIMEREIDEHLLYQFTLPSQKAARHTVYCRFQTSVVEHHFDMRPLLTVVQGDKAK